MPTENIIKRQSAPRRTTAANRPLLPNICTKKIRFSVVDCVWVRACLCVCVYAVLCEWNEDIVDKKILLTDGRRHTHGGFHTLHTRPPEAQPSSPAANKHRCPLHNRPHRQLKQCFPPPPRSTPPTKTANNCLCIRKYFAHTINTFVVVSPAKNKQKNWKQEQQEGTDHLMSHLPLWFFFHLHLQLTLAFMLMRGCTRILYFFQWDVGGASGLISITHTQ